MAKAAALENVREDAIMTNSNSVDGTDVAMEEAFPDVAPGIEPFGNLVLVQIRRPRKFTKSGIELPAEARSTEYYNTQVAKVIALGNLCFKSVRNVDGEEQMLDWPEGQWFEPGEFVRVPKYGGDRFVVVADVVEQQRMIGGAIVPTTIKNESIVFAFYKARDVQGKITTDPRSIRAYLD